MKYQIIIFILSCWMYIAGCSSSSTGDSTSYLGKGDYPFTMSDSLNTKLAEGILKVKVNDSNSISGEYKFTSVQNEFPGYSSMSGGKFEGTVNQKEKYVLINTNPGIADDNVFFNLKIMKSSLEGDWYYSAFRKTFTPGKIKAVKK